MLKLLNDWGFTGTGWRSGEHGEYLVVIQGLLFLAFLFLPAYHPANWVLQSQTLLYLRFCLSAVLGLAASFLILKGLFDLGSNLTPLPYPKEQGKLVKSGVYAIVRHPLYSGLIVAAFGWSIFQGSLSHLLAAAIVFIFFDVKASREETWLTQKYPEYSEYKQRVKKLIPGLY